ncbi:hypothetical protein M0R04_06745 [Candidatus Dojkabacteria bacterium]|jgi:hypothetical protein|nr:hypothetical protein [Candidatus Dojkabacteria bacterium]
MNIKDLTQSIIAVLIVGGAVASLFVPVVSDAGNQLIRFAAGVVLGFYFGAGTVPTFGLRK